MGAHWALGLITAVISILLHKKHFLFCNVFFFFTIIFLFICGTASTSRHSLSARRHHVLPREDASFPGSQSSDSDTLLDTHYRGRHLRKQTSLRSSRNREQLQSSDEEYALSTSDDSRISSRISSPDNGNEISSDTPSLHNSVEGAQLLTSSAGVNSQPPGSWECHGARPKQIQRSLVPAVRGEPVLPVIYRDGIDPSFLARHSQDNTGCDSPYQSSDSEIPVLNGSPSNGGLCNDSESSDDQQMLTLKCCVATSHILIERVLQEREREEQLRREQRVTRERRHNEEERENQEAERRPQQETVIASPQHCRFWFSCCMQFYPCLYCHSNVCDKAGHATHFKCSCYQHEQQVLLFFF